MTKLNFNPTANRFNLQNALVLAECSSLAYEDENTIQSKVKKEWVFDECKFKECSETQFYIAKSEDLILLAFRGTEKNKIADILIDLFAWRTKAFWGSVHAGFSVALDFVFNDIVALLKKMQDNDQPIWITGHSLGGALAILASARLACEAGVSHIQGIYTYGQPLVGDKRFKKEFTKVFSGKCYRVTNYRDPVSLVPLKFWKYRHVGQIVLFNQEGKRVEKSDFWTRISLVIIPLIIAFIAFLRKKKDLRREWIGKVTDPHDLERYKNNIEKSINSLIT
ncbi:MAG: lipase family protein [Candidatus Aceula lacicola]|nr:lipase family protein [Candidatus Aceula lacicola]